MPVLEVPAPPSRPSVATNILNSRKINHVVVLGANGNMGYGSGALFTTAVPKVTFLARTVDKAEQGLGKAIRSVRSATVGLRVEVGSYDADMARALADADLIFEAVAEDFQVKDELYAKVDSMRRADSIVASVTSGLSITALAAKRSASFQKNFLGLHFFNPPNVIVGTEIIAGEKTDPEVVEFIDAYATKKLGRVIIRTSDTPGFAGNRVGFKVLNEVAQLAETHGPVLMDKLIGPYTGRAMSPLATIDLVGWDVHHAIVDNVYDNAKNDEARETNKMPAYMLRLMHDRGVMGTKSGMGFFKKDEQRMALDVDTGDYVPVKQAKLPPMKFIEEISQCHRVGEYARGMAIFAKAHGDEAALAKKVIAGYIAYAFNRAGEVTETITGIDLIMGCGFNWAPPSVLVDVIGLKQTVAMIEKAGLAVPKILEEALSRKSKERFFNDPRVNIGKFFVAK